MIKTKIDISKWIKVNFNNAEELKDFLEFDHLNTFVLAGKQLLPQYQEEYNTLKCKWEKLLNTINNFPEILITEFCGKGSYSKTMRTPLNYMSSYYYADAEKRNKLFKSDV